MTLSEVQRQRAIFERSTIGVVEVDMDGGVTYANRHAMDLLGLRTYEGLLIQKLFADPVVFQQQIEERRAGLISSYRTQVVRQSDARLLSIQVTAIPVTSPDGTVVSSFALFRHPLEEEINRLHQQSDEGNSVLYQVMQALHLVIPFDMVTATRFSDDMRHALTFFVFRPKASKGRVEWRKHWQAIPQSMRDQVSESQTVLFPDLMERLMSADMDPLRDSPTVQMLLQDGLQSCIRRPLCRKGRTLASVTFFSKAHDGLTEDHRRRIEELPIAACVMQAIDYFDRKRDAERHRLLREVSYCPTVEAVYEALLRRLCEIFGWSNASIYRVDHAKGRIRLVGACVPPSLPVVAGLTYEQSIDKGILGRVVASGRAQVIGDIASDPDFIEDETRPEARSELCWPIELEGDAKVRWIIDVLDARPDAFADEEKRWLGEVGFEVGGFMQRLSTLNFLSECLESTSEPIVAVDALNNIKRANKAAAALFDVPDPKSLQGQLKELFCTPEKAQEAFDLPDGYLGEFSVRRQRSGVLTWADVSRKPLPAGIGGAIYVFRDTRPIRRALELELMEQTAYEIALETRTPITFAISSLERSVRNRQAMTASTAERLLQYLYRAQHAYTKLAMYHPAVRASEGDYRLIDLDAEVRALYLSLPAEMRALVRVVTPVTPAKIVGDCFQVIFVLEVLLTFFIRTSPEEIPVIIEVASSPEAVAVHFEGFIPTSGEGSEETGSVVSATTDRRLASPLIKQYLARNGGSLSKAQLAPERVRYSLNFLPAG